MTGSDCRDQCNSQPIRPEAMHFPHNLERRTRASTSACQPFDQQEVCRNSVDSIRRRNPRVANEITLAPHESDSITSKNRCRSRYKIWYILKKRSLLSVVNLVTFLSLAWHMISISFSNSSSESPSLHQSYPLSLILEVQRHNLTISPSEFKSPYAGYASVKDGTFRDKYPSTSIVGSNTFDEIIVITSPKCEHQWEEFQRHANKMQLSYLKWPQNDMRHMTLRNPPIPIAPSALHDSVTGNRAVMSILKRQLLYLDAHRRAWDFVVKTGKNRVLVLDDTLFPTNKLLRSFPSMLSDVDQESIARQQSWHFIFLRRWFQENDKHWKRENVWSMNSVYNQPVVHAGVSNGAGAYVISLQGARLLLEQIQEYRAPLDVEIGRLQKEFPNEFVALSTCNSNSSMQFCPESIIDISTQHSKLIFDCVWRRLQERRASRFSGRP